MQEQLSDPDPLLRLAYMEDILASGDTLRMRIAMRTAFAGDDPDLRALALRGYLAGHKEFTFDITLPPAMQKALDSRTPSNAQELSRQYPMLSVLSSWSKRVHLELTEFNFADSSGQIKATETRPARFAITGDVLSTVLGFAGVGQCYIDFGPTARQTLEGTMACQNWPKLAITTQAM